MTPREALDRWRAENPYATVRLNGRVGYLTKAHSLVSIARVCWPGHHRNRYSDVFERYLTGQGTIQLEIKQPNGRYRPAHEVLGLTGKDS